jgi:hypothetical protein
LEKHFELFFFETAELFEIKLQVWVCQFCSFCRGGLLGFPIGTKILIL